MSDKSRIYLERYAYPKRYLDHKPHPDTQVVVVIPCYDEPDLVGSLQSIQNCEMPCPVEVIVVINASESSAEEIKQRNQTSYEQAVSWRSNQPDSFITFHFILENNLPTKHAGVGLARKIGMDEAVRLFDTIDKPEGVILCYDADCRCQPNLLKGVYDFFEKNDKSPGCSIHYEHPLEGYLSEQHYSAIINYELHLRYYINALQYANYPYAYHTIGSSMAARSSAYQKQGGMNRRKAGEDFYFLHKIIPLGNFGKVNSTAIYPSARASHRVPFGTGRAVGQWLDSGEYEFMTYDPAIFENLKIFIDSVDSLFGNQSDETLNTWPEIILSFLREQSFDKKLLEINKQSTSLEAFRKRFFQWFDGFKVLKYVHFARNNQFPNVSIEQVIKWLFTELGLEKERGLKKNLITLRKYDKGKAETKRAYP